MGGVTTLLTGTASWAVDYRLWDFDNEEVNWSEWPTPYVEANGLFSSGTALAKVERRGGGSLDWRVRPPQQRDEGGRDDPVEPHMMVLEDGAQLRFHIAPDADDEQGFFGIVSLEFYDPGSGTAPILFEAGGVTVGYFADWGDSHYRARFGRVWKYPQSGGLVSRGEGWHTVRWEFRKQPLPVALSVDPWNDGQAAVQRWCAVYVDGVLLGRHVNPARMRSLSVNNHWGTALDELWIDNVQFTPYETMPGVWHLAMGPREDGFTGGIARPDFDVVTDAADGTLAYYVKGITSLSGKYLHVFAVSITQGDCPTGTQAVFAKHVNLAQKGLGSADARGFRRITGLTSGEDQAFPVGDGGETWQVLAVVTNDANTPYDKARLQTYNSGGTKTVYCFDERIVMNLEPPAGSAFCASKTQAALVCDDPEQGWEYSYDVTNGPDWCWDENDANPPYGYELTYVEGFDAKYYAELDGRANNFTFRIPVSPSNYNRLHEVIIYYPSDKPRDMWLSVTEMNSNNADPPTEWVSGREPISANVFLPGGWDPQDCFFPDDYIGLPFVPQSLAFDEAMRKFYIYPGGDLLVTALCRTTGMPAAIRRIEVRRATGTPVPGPTGCTSIGVGVQPSFPLGAYLESPSCIRNLFGVFSNHPDYRIFWDWADAPSVFDLPARERALRNWVEYLHSVYVTGQDVPALNLLSYDVWYYKSAYWPSHTAARLNWEMSDKIGEVNYVNGVQYHVDDSPNELADFDFVGYTAAFCQSAGLKFLPVLDFRGNGRIDYWNGEGNPYGVNGWSNLAIQQFEDEDERGPVTLNSVAYDSRVAGTDGVDGDAYDEGKGVRRTSCGDPMLEPVRAELLSICEELNRSLAPFMPVTNYFDGVLEPSVLGLAILMDERNNLNLMTEVSEGNQRAFWQQQWWWQQEHWGWSDTVWREFRTVYPNVPACDTGTNRFGLRYEWVMDSNYPERKEAWNDWRHEKMASLYADMFASFGGDAVQDAGFLLAFLYNSPSYPNIADSRELLEQGSPAAKVLAYLTDGASEPSALLASLAQFEANVTFCKPTWSFHRRWDPYYWANGQNAGHDVADWYGEQQGLRTWEHMRWFDSGSSAQGSTWEALSDLYHPEGVSSMAGWVYHEFMEAGTQWLFYRKAWGPDNTFLRGLPDGAPSGSRAVTIGSPGEAATPHYRSGDGMWLYWDVEPPPAYQAAWPDNPYNIMSWCVPYSSQYWYWQRRELPVRFFLSGGWDNTSLYGHEDEFLRSILLGGVSW